MSPKNKALCVGDLIRYYGETKYKIIESVEKLNSSETTKGMVANLLRKAMSNPMASSIFDNLSELAKKDIFSFTVDGVNPIVFEDAENGCSLVVKMSDEYFQAKAIYAMMRPGFRKYSFEECIEREKQDFRRWFDKNLKEYASSYRVKVLEE
jgi:hypothetical protein